MSGISIQAKSTLPAGQQAFEYVERKGIGHPDTICDSVMESISVALCKAYVESCGRLLHHNIDKGLLVAGQTTPRLGGGSVDLPMRLVVGDRATLAYHDLQIPVGDVVEAAIYEWISGHLRCVKPQQHIEIQNELRPGSAELTAAYAGEVPVANDTSVGVGYAPLSETEHLVLAAEHLLNSSEFKHEFPETGEDVKVMAVRQGRELQLTVAIAFVDEYIWDEATYFRRKKMISQELQALLESKMHALDRLAIDINALDRAGHGVAGMYLTVLGTSAESGDSGQVGRGNRVNGLISLNRPMTLEAAAGKNPLGHVGKIYNLLAHRIADEIYASSAAVEEAYVWICSRIGAPLSQPWSVSVQLALTADATIADIEEDVKQIVGRELADIASFTARLAHGELNVC